MEMEVENLETEAIDALVEIGLYEQCMKDRPGYKSGVRPNHWMPGREYCFMGQLEFTDREWLKPGDSCIANGKFIIASQDVKSFVPGYAWHICEANKIVGYGKVIELKNT